MKIGLLLCDDIDADLQDQYGTYTDMFSAGLQAADTSMQIQPYRVYQNEYPEVMDECDGWLISGSRSGVYEDKDWIRKGMQLVRDADAIHRKVVGICFGHQLVIQAMGGDVQKADVGWGIGIKTSQVYPQPNWMKKLPTSINLIYLHQDQALSLPENTTVIAGSDFCPYSVVQIGSNILGIQGHPEFSKAFCRQRIKDRSDIIPKATAEAAFASFDKDLDADIIFENITRFLKT